MISSKEDICPASWLICSKLDLRASGAGGFSKDTFDIIEEEKTSAKSLESNLINRFGNPNLKLQKINDVWAIVLKKSN